MTSFTKQFKKYFINQLLNYDFSEAKHNLIEYWGGCNWPGGDNGSVIKLGIKGPVTKSGYNLHIGGSYHPALYQTPEYDINQVVAIIENYQFDEQWCKTTMYKGSMYNYGKPVKQPTT
jgi:hypothetical protein